MNKRATVWLLVLMFSFLSGASCPKQGDNPELSGMMGGRDLFMQGESSFEAGDYETARKYYQQVMEENPTSSWSNKAQFRIGQCYFKMDRTDEALAEFNRYIDNNRDDSDLTAAQDYVIRILENDLVRETARRQAEITGYEQQNFRLEMLNKYLRRSVESEVVYLELDLEANSLFVKIGSQTLYEYPMVTGKGRRTLQTTGSVKDFSTPKGIHQVEAIVKDPIWYRPDWVWLEKGEEVPEDLTMEERGIPGILGPYKVSLGGGVYIHGTSRGKIRPGKYSHGCVRLNNSDLKQLVKLVEVGTMVYVY